MTSALLVRLRDLLSNLIDANEIIKNWPESEGDDANVHKEATTTLIESLHTVIRSLKRVEHKALGENGSDNQDLRKHLTEAQVPLDLLELMDHGNNLNPECFRKQLIREALRHLAALRRRRNALEMLGKAIEAGLNKKDENERKTAKNAEAAKVVEDTSKGTKRSRDCEVVENSDEPSSKR
mmetsp:Transcript_46840/g.69299  ORF Transcript_46840/g.69299 Transcript_46840/m.69299 type:complete len:181 (-) Transcript_46840:109-651(-)|eukprot:CAMPEP_0195513198 /NCGR_PEP_ID=MMETSP0794_2-20130614/4907_1 /TAXON_ID=515487 /ORGANISM="Stephanopyxis turris, Strain CCMP 815" /LENGTH=180 /DNA_ID=CAMNT_0040641147 /DNA_START=208 /DNA_END=750 /DNA_ORIENTATION=-